MAEPQGKIDISRVLNNTFGVISRNAVIFLGLSLAIVGLPNAAMEALVSDPAAVASAFDAVTAIVTGILGFLLFLFLSIVLQATLIVATLNDLGGREVILGDCISQAIRKFLPLLGLGILVAIGVAIGMVLLIVPGVILYLMWIVAAPVMMAEDRGVIDSLQRSAELTSGSKGMIFVLMIIFIVAAMIVGGIAGAMSFFSVTATIILSAIVNTITGALQGAGVAAIYVDLRQAKEGTDTSSLADIFA